MRKTCPQLALVGISGYGRIHLDLVREWTDRGLARLAAAVVINPKEEQEAVTELQQQGCRIYPSHETMWESEAGQIDLCLIPTGIHLHARMTIMALRAGANVLVEKPLAGSTAETESIRAVERTSGRFVAVGFQDVYAPSTAWFTDVLRSGRIGEIRSLRTLCVWPRPQRYWQRNGWAGRLSVDGFPVHDSPLNNACAHFALLSLIFGGCVDEAPLRLESAELFRARAIESFDTAVVRLITVAGTKIWLGVSHSSQAEHRPEILIEGTAGSARWIYESSAAWRNNSGEGETRALGSQHTVRREMMASVLRRVSDPSVEICTTALAARHTSLIDAVHAWAPIATIPLSEITSSAVPDNPEAVLSVRQLDNSLRSGFSTGCTLQAAGFGRTAIPSLH
jgi:predicted dehydrogenase